MRYGGRGLWREPGFAAAAILTLALGVSATTTVFSVVDAELWRPLPFPNPHQLLAVYSRGPEPRVRLDPVSGAELLDWRAGAPALTHLAATGRSTRRTLHLQTADSVLVTEVTPNFFATLGRAAIAGTTFDPARGCGGNAAVLTDRAWRRLFNGDSSVVGRTVSLDSDSIVICGIVKASDALGSDPDLYLALDEGASAFLSRSEPALFGVIGRLAAGAEAGVAQSQLAAVFARNAVARPAGRAGHTVFVEDLREYLRDRREQPRAVLLPRCVDRRARAQRHERRGAADCAGLPADA